MPRRFARENFTSGRRRRPILSSMLKVPIEMAMTTRLDDTNQVGGDFRPEPATGYGAGYLDSSAILREKQATP